MEPTNPDLNSSLNSISNSNPLLSNVGIDGKNQFYYFSTASSSPGNFPSGNFPSGGNFPPGNYFICQNLCNNCGVCPFTTPSATNTSLPAAFYHQNVQYALIQAQNFFNYQIQQTPMSSIDQENSGSDYFKKSLVRIFSLFLLLGWIISFIILYPRYF